MMERLWLQNNHQVLFPFAIQRTIQLITTRSLNKHSFNAITKADNNDSKTEKCNKYFQQ